MRNAWMAVLLLAGCQGSPPAQPEAARRYAVRGEIVQVGAAGAGAQLLVRHEAIDDFVDSAGKVVGMDAMVMPFDVAPPLSASGLSVGDKVAIRFSMDWKASRLRVESVERLPPDTVLRFGAARPAGK